MRMDVDSAGHDDHAARVEGGDSIGQGWDDASVLHQKIASLPIHTVRRVMDRSTHDAELCRSGHREPLPSRAATRPARVWMTEAAERVVFPSGGVSSRGTSSIR